MQWTPPALESPLQRVGAIGLFLLLFCSLSRVTDFFLISFHLPFLLSVFCLATSLVSGNPLAAFRSRIGLVLGLFTIWLILLIPTSVWHGGSFSLVFDAWGKSFGLFVVTTTLLSTLRQTTRVIRVMALAFFATAILALFYGKTSDGRFGLEQGLYAGSNELATAMIQGCVFWWFMIHNPRSALLKRLFAVLALAPLLLILINTASRAGFVVLMVLTVMTFLHYSLEKKFVFLLIVMAVVGAGLSVTPASVKQRIATIFSDPDQRHQMTEALGSRMQRMYLLRRSIEITLQHPILGVGPGQFIVAENGMAMQEGTRGQWLGTHNSYTQVSSETGFPGLLLFVGSLFYCWKELRIAERIHKSNPSPESGEYVTLAYTLRLALVSYMVFFCFEHIAYDPFYPVLAGVIAAFARASRELPVAAPQNQPVAAPIPLPRPMIRRPV